MLFNSIEFVIFFGVIFLAYWFISQRNLKVQNFLVLVASYVFYGWWDWRFLGLVFLSTSIDYTLALWITKSRSKSRRKTFLVLSLVANLGCLAFFKYYNFFIDSLAEAFAYAGWTLNTWTLSIVLPVGISFYTFQTLSYTIDVYREKLKPTRDFIAFAAFVAFFPQLVAGPIERATHLLPQFLRERRFDYRVASSGVKLIVWGFFKKLVVADNAAILVDGVFSNSATQSWVSLLLGVLLFSFQIYCDFSGYSDIAIGIGRLLGFDLMTNFKFPYFSRSIIEFWKRWHISLSTWFRDYLYFPLGGSRGGLWITIRNVFIVFLISGLWHGANWTFVVWGLIHALLYLAVFLTTKNASCRTISPALMFSQMVTTYLVVCLAWIFFRADSIGDAGRYVLDVITMREGAFHMLSSTRYTLIGLISIMGVGLLVFVELIFKSKGKDEVLLPSWALFVLCLIICFCGAYKNHSRFIYFQF